MYFFGSLSLDMRQQIDINYKYEEGEEGFKEKSTCQRIFIKNKITKINFGKRIEMYFFGSLSLDRRQQIDINYKYEDKLKE